MVCVCVCVCVCFPYSGTSRNQAYKQHYQRLQRDTDMKYKKGFFLKTLRSEVMASFAYRDSPRRHALPETPLDIRQKARVLWQSLSLLSQCSEHVTIPLIPREWHGYTDVVFAPPTYFRLLASSTHFITLVNLASLPSSSCLVHIIIYLCSFIIDYCFTTCKCNLRWNEAIFIDGPLNLTLV